MSTRRGVPGGKRSPPVSLQIPELQRAWAAKAIEKTETLEDMLRRAAEGDQIAAKEAHGLLAVALSLDHKHPSTRDPLPVPDFVRRYLSAAFQKMAGEYYDTKSRKLLKRASPGAALNLSGKKKWSQYDKDRAINAVEQFVSQGITVEDSAAIVAQQLTALSKSESADDRKIWPKAIGETQILRWYYEKKKATS